MDHIITDKGAILKFDMNSLATDFLINVESIKNTFFKNLDDTTSKFCDQTDATAHTLSIVTLSKTLFSTPLEDTEVDILDRCLGLLLKKGVQVLEIDIYPDLPAPEYRLPIALLSVSSLTSVTIRGCEFPSFTVDAVKFKSLKLLSLSKVPIDDRMIWCLTTGCPVLEEFNLEHCYGFKRFRVIGHQNLEKIKIFSKDGIKRVDIQAPNLCYLFLNNYIGREAPVMNLESCRKLTTFCYNGFLSKRFINSLSKFPVIENLFLCVPSHCKNLKLYAPSEDLLYPFLTEDSSETKAWMKYDSSKLVDNLWFQKLKRFLDKTNGFKGLKLVFEKDYIDVEEFKVLNSPPYELNHVDLKLGDIVKLPHLVAVMDAVLWCCRPQYLTLKLDYHADSETQTHVIKHTHEKLLRQEDDGRIYIWFVLHHIYGFTYHFKDLNSMLEALTADGLLNKITFVKEEVKTETGDSEAAAE